MCLSTHEFRIIQIPPTLTEKKALDSSKNHHLYLYRTDTKHFICTRIRTHTRTRTNAHQSCHRVPWSVQHTHTHMHTRTNHAGGSHLRSHKGWHALLLHLCVWEREGKCVCDMTYSWHGLLQLLHVCMHTHVCVYARVRDMTHSCVYHGICVCDIWLIHMCAMMRPVACHTNEWVTCHTWMSHGTYTNESFGNCTNESWHTHEWVMAHTRMSHGTYTNKSCHIYEWVRAHTWMSHGTHINESSHTHEWVTAHMNESWHICEWVMAHI